jgi:hypothetical protein
MSTKEFSLIFEILSCHIFHIKHTGYQKIQPSPRVPAVLKDSHLMIIRPKKSEPERVRQPAHTPRYDDVILFHAYQVLFSVLRTTLRASRNPKLTLWVIHYP